MRAEEWVEHFVTEGMDAIDPRRCTVAPAGDGKCIYAAYYDAEDFLSFDEFEAWIAWTTSLQPAMITDGPSLSRVEWSRPSDLRLPYDPLTPGPALRLAIEAMCAQPELAWVCGLTPVNGRLRSEDNLEAQVLGGWLTLFRLDSDDGDALTWTRLDLHDPGFVEHLLSDLTIGLRVDLAGLGEFDALHDHQGSRVWFKASESLLDALHHRDSVLATPFTREVVRALRAGESVYLPDVGLLEVRSVLDVRGDVPRRTYTVRFNPDTALLLDLQERVQASTLPPR